MPAAPVAIARHAPEGQALHVWRMIAKAEPFGAVGNVVVSWDMDRNGIALRSATTGAETGCRTIGSAPTGFRTIEGSRTNGTPEVWQPTASR